MAMRLVTGRAGSGKTRLCLEEIKARLLARRAGSAAAGEGSWLGRAPLIFLVPEQFNLEAEKALISHCDVDGLSDATVLTFKRIAHRVFAGAGMLNRRYINGVGKKICLTAVIEELRGSLVYHARRSVGEGFVDDLAAMFLELKQHNQTPDALLEAADRAEDRSLAQKIRELAALYQRYCARIDDGYLDTDDDLTRLADAIPFSDYIGGAEIWIDGFSGFTAQEYRVVAALMRRAANLTVCLCCDAPDVTLAGRTAGGASGSGPARWDLFAPTRETAAELLRLAAQGDVPVEFVDVRRPDDPAADTDRPPHAKHTEHAEYAEHVEHTEQTGQAEHDKSAEHATQTGNYGGVQSAVGAPLLHMERNLYRSRSRPFPREAGNIRFVECANAFDETEFAAADILSLCREYGYRFGDVAVICSDPESYAALVEPVFARYGIRCFVDLKKDIAEHPLIRLLFSLFSILESRFSYESVFSYLKTGLTDVGQADVDRLENFALARGIRGGMWTSAAAWRDDGLERARRRFLEPIGTFSRAVRGGCTPAEFCGAVYTFLTDCGARRVIMERLAGAQKTPDERAAASELKQIWGFAADVLDQIVELGYGGSLGNVGSLGGGDRAPEKRPLEVYARMFRSGAMSYRVGAIPPSADEVLVGSTERTRSHAVKALYVLGANDGLFPASPRPTSLLTDADRVALRGLGLSIAKDSVESSFDALFNVYATLTIPTRHLRIFWPLAGRGGKAAKPAPVIRLLQKLFPHNKTIRPDTEAFSKSLFRWRTGSPESAFQGLVGALREAADHNPRRADGFAAELAADLTHGPGGKAFAALSPNWRAVYAFMRRDAQMGGRLRAIAPSLLYRDAGVKFSDAAIRLLHPNAAAKDGLTAEDRFASADHLAISVSRLERYAACPFSYLGEYLIAARPRKQFRIEAPDIGVFVHRAIELSARGLSEADGWQSLSPADCAARSEDAVERILSEDADSVFLANKRNSFLLERVKATVAWSLLAIARHVGAGNYRPWRFEMPFLDETSGIGLADGRRVALRGIVDRVDIARPNGARQGSVRVVDFKTGHRELSMSDIANGLSFQLPVYLDIALRAAAEADAADTADTEDSDGAFLPGGMFYFETRQPFLNLRKEGRGQSSADGASILDELLDLLEMDGFVIGDENTYAETYETGIFDSGKSNVVRGISIKRDGAFAKRVFAPSAEDFFLIRRAVARNIKALCEGLYGGDYRVSPYKKKDRTPCAYCPYRGACGIDLMAPGTAFRAIPQQSNAAVLAALRDENTDSEALP
ncbi:MAG: exodeoxyribonuclease V subunit gamma [Clostridiales bacterium]|nr:exodeoxyribonuclease V subunit gamma [Clostridiales bacterium]